MDSLGSSLSTSEIQGLPEHDKRELEQFVRQETQKATIQATIHSLTDMCFKKCIKSTINSGKLVGQEQSCMDNCVGRFMDANNLVMKQLESLRNA